MRRTLIACLVVAVCGWGHFAEQAAAEGAVDLLFDPPATTVPDGGTVEIDLIAHSADGTPQDMFAVEAIISWDPSVLELVGFDAGASGVAWAQAGFLNDPDGINDGIDVEPLGVPFNDGDAIYTALTPIAGVTVGPADLVVTTLVFAALSPGPPTTVSILPSLGAFGQTHVYGEGIGMDITGDISGTAIVTVCVPGGAGDADGDCDVDLDDYALFAGCLAGPDVDVPPAECTAPEFSATDLDGDDDVDLADLAGFQQVFSGPLP